MSLGALDLDVREGRPAKLHQLVLRTHSDFGGSYRGAVADHCLARVCGYLDLSAAGNAAEIIPLDLDWIGGINRAAASQQGGNNQKAADERVGHGRPRVRAAG